MRFKIGDKVTMRGSKTNGEVVVIVPPMANPFIEIKRCLGNVANVRIEKPERGFLPLREIESYVVKFPYGGGVGYKWPRNVTLGACDG